MTIERPRCPNCQSTAILARTTRGSCGFDIGTFQCPACDLVHQFVVNLIDPMKSLETLVWFLGEFTRADVSRLGADVRERFIVLSRTVSEAVGPLSVNPNNL
jgi:hypothetical protein